MNILFRLFGLLVWLTLSACGSGGNDEITQTQSQPIRVSLRLTSAGTLTSNLSSISLTVTLPEGFSVDVDNSGKPVSTVIIPSGIATSISTIPLNKITYVAPTKTTTGSLAFEINTTMSDGFGTGEFASLMLIVAPGHVVIPPMFTTSNLTATDVIGNVQGGISISLQ